MRDRLSRILRHKLTENLISLYGAHFARYLLPLITVPFLARVLGVSAWGTMAFVQAFVAYVSLLLEFGFGLSATREVARCRDSRDKLADVLSGVLGAKVFLALIAVGFALLIRPCVPLLRDNPRLLGVGVFGAVVQGFNLLWYYQGLERMRLVAALDILTRVMGTAGIFLLVRSPEDDWKVLASYALANLVSVVLAFAMAYREIPFRVPTKRQVLETLRVSRPLFLVRAGASFFSAGNIVILGLFVPPVLVGYFAGAERIATSVRRLLTPAVDALYPRLSYLVSLNRQHAACLIKRVLVAFSAFGIILGGLVFFFAPLLVRILLGEEFGPAVPVLRVLALLPPLVGVNHVLGSQWMLPLGLDRTFSSIVLGGGTLNFLLAFLVLLLVPHYAHVGVAWAIILTQMSLTLTYYLALRWRRLDPFSYAADLRSVQSEEGWISAS